MIVDNIANAKKYESISPAFKAGMEFLAAHADGMSQDRVDITPDVYALRKSYDSKEETDCKWEAHKEFIDVQYVASGREAMGWGPRENFEVVEYKEQKDFIHLSGKGEMYPLTAGTFMVLFPDDAHLPMVKLGENCPIEKVILKIRVGK